MDKVPIQVWLFSWMKILFLNRAHWNEYLKILVPEKIWDSSHLTIYFLWPTVLLKLGIDPRRWYVCYLVSNCMSSIFIFRYLHLDHRKKFNHSSPVLIKCQDYRFAISIYHQNSSRIKKKHSFVHEFLILSLTFTSLPWIMLNIISSESELFDWTPHCCYSKLSLSDWPFLEHDPLFNQ